MSKICKTCDNDKFEYNDGFYYCTVCGSKTHVSPCDSFNRKQ